jgi:hypothetical protein
MGMKLSESEELEIFTSLDENEDGELNRSDLQKFLNLLKGDQPEDTPCFAQGLRPWRDSFQPGLLNEYIKIQLKDEEGEETISAISSDFVDSLTKKKLDELKRIQERFNEKKTPLFPLSKLRNSKLPKKNHSKEELNNRFGRL